MKKLLFLLLIFIITGCNTVSSVVEEDFGARTARTEFAKTGTVVHLKVSTDVFGDNTNPIADGKFTALTVGTLTLVNPLSGLATSELDNLGVVAINTSLISDTDGTDNLGSTAVRWANGWFDDIAITNDLAVAEGGTGASSLADLIALTTNTTGNYTASIADSGNSNITVVNGATEGGAVTLDVVDVTCTDCLNATEIEDIYALLAGATFTGEVVAPFINFNSPSGFLTNGKIVPSVATNDLTLAIKGLDGNDPSASNPVSIRIGDTMRTITSALSVTKLDSTNWFDSGGSELATKETDYFVYLGFNATDGVVIGFSRIPYATVYNDFSATTTNEKYAAISDISNAAATDDYVNIGRFAATLSAGAGYTWTVPSFTTTNLIQKPIFEGRRLTYMPVYVGFSSDPGSNVTYQVINDRVRVIINDSVGTSNASNFTMTLPFVSSASQGGARGATSSFDNDSHLSTPGYFNLDNNSRTVALFKETIGVNNWTASGGKIMYFNLMYSVK